MPPNYDGPLPAFVTNMVKYIDIYVPASKSSKKKRRIRYLIDYKHAQSNASLVQLWHFAIVTADRHFAKTMQTYDKSKSKTITGAASTGYEQASEEMDEEEAERVRLRQLQSAELLQRNRDAEIAVKEAEKSQFREKLRAAASQPNQSPTNTTPPTKDNKK